MRKSDFPFYFTSGLIIEPIAGVILLVVAAYKLLTGFSATLPFFSLLLGAVLGMMIGLKIGEIAVDRVNRLGLKKVTKMDIITLLNKFALAPCLSASQQVYFQMLPVIAALALFGAAISLNNSSLFILAIIVSGALVGSEISSTAKVLGWYISLK